MTEVVDSVSTEDSDRPFVDAGLDTTSAIPTDAADADASTCAIGTTSLTVTGYDQGVTSPTMGCTAQSKIGVAIRTSSGTAFFDSVPYDGPTGGHGTRVTQSVASGVCACNCASADVAISASVGTIELTASNGEFTYLVVSVSMAELLWQYRFGTTPDVATYFSEAWRQHLFAMLDCSPYARAGTTCTISHVIPPGTFTPQGALIDASTAICGHFAAILRSG